MDMLPAAANTTFKKNELGLLVDAHNEFIVEVLVSS